MQKNLVFVHVHRTGGSSVWHNLVPLGERAGWGICDIYYQSKLAYGVPIRANDVLANLRQEIGSRACLFHHHTTEPIRQAFDETQVVYATVLRDPVDRFVSLVHHIAHFFKSPETTPEYAAYYAALCGENFCQAVAKPKPAAEELFEAALPESFFSNYYTQLFRSLCWSRDEASPSPAVTPQELSDEVLRQFTVIGWYSELELAFARIVETFGIGTVSDRMKTVVNRSEPRPLLTPLLRQRLERRLEAEYAFVEQLRVARPSRAA